MADPTYDQLWTLPLREGPARDTFPAPRPGAGAAIGATWQLGLTPQFFETFEDIQPDPVEGYDPWPDLRGYELYAEDLVGARSPQEMALIKAHIDRNIERSRTIAAGEWGFMAQLGIGLAAGAGDPVNWIPLPMTKGLGFIRGAAMGAGSNAALTAVTEPVNIALDPARRFDAKDYTYSLGMGALLGAAFGGIGGMRGERTQGGWGELLASGQKFEDALNHMEGENVVRRIDFAEEGIAVERNAVNHVDEAGMSRPIALVDRIVDVPEKTLDGVNYVWEGEWKYASDRGRASGSPGTKQVSEGEIARLGTPEQTTERRLLVNEVALRADYERGNWREVEGSSEVIRNFDEYMTYRSLKELFERELPRKADESPVDHAARLDEKTIAEMKGSKASSSVARAAVFGEYLDKLNLSLPARTVRMFATDNVLSSLPLKLAGDYGWMVRANKFGYKSPPSILLRQMQHNYTFYKLRKVVDEQWLRYVTGRSEAKGTEVMGMNVQAQMFSWKNWGEAKAGRVVLTRRTFDKMVGLAVAHGNDDSILVDGFPIVPEAYEAARKGWTALVAEPYERMAQELGLFADSEGIDRTVRNFENISDDIKTRMVKWLWDGEEGPSALKPAILVKGDKNRKTKSPVVSFSKDGKSHELFTIANRAMVVVDINGVKQPFYVSTGTGGKKSVAKGKWYPFFGFGPDDGWLNKGTEAEINAHYGSPYLHYVANWLNSKYPDPDVDKLIGGIDFRGNHPDWKKANSIDIGSAFDQLKPADRKNPVSVAKNIQEQVDRINEAASKQQIGFEDDRIFVGKDHSEAILEMHAALGERAGSINVTSDMRGWQRNGKFVSNDVLIKERLESMSPKQQRVYETMKESLDQATFYLESYKAIQAQKDVQAHAFYNQLGQREPYLPRNFDKIAMVEGREKFVALLTHWYQKDNPLGAEERAIATYDRIMKENTGTGDGHNLPGVPHLWTRDLNIPNSYTISDPNGGTIRMTDFIVTDIMSVAESYIRRMGTKIEIAKMFGDGSMNLEMARVRAHFEDTYLKPAADDAKKYAAAKAMMKEYEGNITTIRDLVLGHYRNDDPWSFSNRSARFLKNWTAFSVMGRVVLSSLSELARIAMTQGFRVAYGAFFARMAGSLDNIKANKELAKMTGEILDMIRDRFHARMVEANMTDPWGGGTRLERWLEEAKPGFFKLTLLTPWTTMLKEWSMFATQHNILEGVAAIRAGTASEKVKSRLAALGIMERDALLMSRMPTEMHGSIRLASVNGWTGSEGIRARQLLIDAMTGEARRAIVTPGPADQSTIFHGFIMRRGKKVVENDWLTVPVQLMSYGVTALPKIMLSALQGRDANALGGIVAMVGLGYMANYLKTPSNAWHQKDSLEHIIAAWETSGVGGLWFGDMNNMIERATQNTVGLRPLLGLDPKFGKGTEMDSYIDALGVGPSTAFDMSRAIWDPDLSATQRAQTIRRGLIGNNVIWWGGIARDLATSIGSKFEK